MGTDQVVYALLDALGESPRFGLTGDDQDDFSAVQHGCDSDGQRHVRHFGDVIVKESRVGLDRLVCERLDPCARLER
jgi:hypothetical protein